MAKDQADFTKGRMNKSVDERLLPKGEYIDAQNVRLGSTELSEVGAVENAKGNSKLTALKYAGVDISGDAVCIGAFDDGSEETMYWFVHDGNNPTATGGVVDMIVSFNTQTQQLTYHVVTTALLNFNPTYLINGINKIGDLLFFTDDYNPPRKINVTRGYPPPNGSHVDQISEIDISVIKPQPKESPVIVLQTNSDKSNYIKDTFISFAYRYKYKDGEYSALSQFSQPAFSPSIFFIKDSNMINNGMENQFNTVKITYNTGIENVIGIDIVYKASDSNVIYVVKKIDKQGLSIPSNVDQSILFSNGDVYTILSQSEILRMYDNVPRLAKAQSIMGNRLMYGNYLEGRDVVNEYGNKVDFNYEVSTVSKVGILEEIEYDTSDAISYDYELTGNTITKTGSSLLIETSGRPSDYYSDDVTLKITMVFRSTGIVDASGLAVNMGQGTIFYGIIPDPNGDTFILNLSYTPDQDYQTAYQAYGTSLFKDKTGENGFEQDPLLWGEDDTLTGRFNYLTPRLDSFLPNIIPSYVPLRSSRDSVSLGEFIKLEVLPNGDMRLVPNAIRYETSSNTFNIDVFQFFQIQKVSVSWSRSRGQKSLHSDRDYQVGILYEDDNGRYSAVFESALNSVYIPTEKSDDINSLKVTIPPSMRPPAWASRYKFLVKQGKTDYETIFSTKSYIDDETGRYWVLLDGEQGNKVSIGQELIVKKDGAGAIVTDVTTTVLDVSSKATGDIYNVTLPNNPSGVYASMSPDGWNVVGGNLTTFTNGQYSTGETTGLGSYLQNGYPVDVFYPLHNTTTGENWTIESGDVVTISFSFVRRGSSAGCGDEICFFKQEYVSSGEYSDFRDFWIQEPVDISFTDCSQTTGAPNATVFIQDEYLAPNTLFTNINIDGVNQIMFSRTQSVPTPRLWLTLISGSKTCGRRSIIKCNIQIVRASGLLVFETKPTATSDNIYFENEQSFPITGGFHTSGNIEDDQDQTAIQDGIVNLTFFNCFTFLNGVESYKVKDSLVGKRFYLGNRVTSVSYEDYKEVRRGASITYSGVYNEQTNINRTNEFNLGLSNYKDCEISYGPIQVLHGRNTDLLTLQEDKISYISIGKNLLQAADGAGVLTSVPIVLGTQLARVEEYGISENPESFAHYGSDIYFTDAKRSSVIQLKGGSSGEALSVISDVGMRSWFRDLFQTSFNYQKLGGYDPYMDEYVLSPNTNLLPFEEVVYGCGGLSRVFTGLIVPTQFTVEAGLLYGNVTILIEATNEVAVTVTYNGTTTAPVSGVGSLSLNFDKNVPSVTTFVVTVTPIDIDSESSTEVLVGCPIADTINIVTVVITSATDQGELIHNVYGYSDATVSPTYQSPLQSNQTQFITPSGQTYVSPNLISLFGPAYTAQQGSGSAPIDGSTVAIVSFKAFGDTFDFDPLKNSLRYLRTPTAYQNNAADIATLLSSSTTTPNLGAAPLFYGNFPMPAGGDGDYLYLIWDYRDTAEMILCYAPTISETCCECFSSPTCFPFLGSAIAGSSTAACLLPDNTDTYYLGIDSNGWRVYGPAGCGDVSSDRFNAGFINFDDNGTAKWIQIDVENTIINDGTC